MQRHSQLGGITFAAPAQVGVFPVEFLEFSGDTQKPFHALDQIWFLRFDHEMKTITHEAPGVNLPVSFGACLADCKEEAFAVLVVTKNILSAIAAVQDVVNGAFVLQAKLSGQQRTIAQRQKLSIVSLTSGSSMPVEQVRQMSFGAYVKPLRNP